MNYEAQERTMTDYQTWTNRMVGKVYYELDPANENRFRTIRISFNPFANKLVPQITNYVEGSPPDTMPALPPNLLGSLMRFQNTNHSFY